MIRSEKEKELLILVDNASRLEARVTIGPYCGFLLPITKQQAKSMIEWSIRRFGTMYIQIYIDKIADNYRVIIGSAPLKDKDCPCPQVM